MFGNYFSTLTTGFVAGSAIAASLLGVATEASAFSISNQNGSITRFFEQEIDYQITNSDGIKLYINGDSSGGFNGFIWSDSQSDRIDFSFLNGGTWNVFEQTFLSALAPDANTTGWWEKTVDGYNVGISGGATFNIAAQTSTDVPEPITGLVVAAGLGGVALRRAKKSKQS
jgi:hypothetical protein